MGPRKPERWEALTPTLTLFQPFVFTYKKAYIKSTILNVPVSGSNDCVM